jgi:hypothetical protein
MLDKQTAVLAETKELTSNVKMRCDGQWRVTRGETARRDKRKAARQTVM